MTTAMTRTGKSTGRVYYDVADADACNMLTADAADDVLAACLLSSGSSAVWSKSSLFREVALEQKFHTGLGGIGPNLDVLLTCADGALFGIESKFTEPYTNSVSKTFLKPKYFLGGRSLWTERGLPGCQAVADGLRDGRHRFKVLDVAQLLKHMLALAHSGSPWSLCCLWFEGLGPLAEQHRTELDDLAMQLGDDTAHFSALTYQELFARMVPILGQQHAGHMAYLSDRYMSDAGAGVTPV